MGEPNSKSMCINCGRQECSRKLTEEQLADMIKETEQLANAIAVLVHEATTDDVKMSGPIKAFIHEMARQGHDDTMVGITALVAIAHSSGADPLHLIARIAARLLGDEK